MGPCITRLKSQVSSCFLSITTSYQVGGGLEEEEEEMRKKKWSTQPMVVSDKHHKGGVAT